MPTNNNSNQSSTWANIGSWLQSSLLIILPIVAVVAVIVGFMVAPRLMTWILCALTVVGLIIRGCTLIAPIIKSFFADFWVDKKIKNAEPKSVDKQHQPTLLNSRPKAQGESLDAPGPEAVIATEKVEQAELPDAPSPEVVNTAEKVEQVESPDASSPEVTDSSEEGKRAELLIALQRNNDPVLKDAKNQANLQSSFIAFRHMIKQYPYPIEENTRLKSAIAALRQGGGSIAQWKAAFKQAGFGLQNELASAIEFQEKKKAAFKQQADAPGPMEPLRDFLSGRDVYFLNGPLIVKLIVEKQALRHELAAREMSEILGLPTLRTMLGHLESIGCEASSTLTHGSEVCEDQEDSGKFTGFFLKTGQLPRKKIERCTRLANITLSDWVVIQEHAGDSLNFLIHHLFSGIVATQPQAPLNTTSSDLSVQQQALDLTLNVEGRAALEICQHIDTTSYQWAVVQAFVLGNIDDFNDIMVKPSKTAGSYDIHLTDFEKIMPESNTVRDYSVRILASGTQDLQTGVIKDLRYKKGSLQGTMAFSSHLLALQQATEPFSPSVLKQLLACLDLAALDRYHLATMRKNHFNAQQITAQKERIESLRKHCEVQLGQESITLTPRQLYDQFYQKNPAYNKVAESFCTDFFRYQVIGRISQPLADGKESVLQEGSLRGFLERVAVEKKPEANACEQKFDAPEAILREPLAAEIIIGMHLLAQQQTEHSLLRCKELQSFLGVKNCP